MKLSALRNTLTLLLVVATTAATNVEGTTHHYLRQLQEGDPACDTEIATLTVQEVEAFAETILQSALGLAGLQDFQETLKGQLITPFLKYGLSVRKVCGSCDDIWKHWDTYSYSGSLAESFDGFCGNNVHGSDATHSALVFLPIDSNNNDTDPILGNLPGFVHMHSFVTDLGDCPTEKWPASISDTIQATVANNAFVDFLIAFQDFLAGALVASSGAVSIFPDYIGYGESTEFSRSNMIEVYAQAAVISYASTGLHLKDETHGCTNLANVGSMLGLSEGGFAVVAAAESLQDFIDIRHVASGAGPLNTFAQMVSVVDAYDTGIVSPALNNLAFQVIVPFVGFVHSNDLPGLANTGSVEQRFLSPDFQDPTDISTDVFQWFSEPTALNFLEALALSPPNALDTLNPDLVSVLRESGARGEIETCPADLIESGVNDLLCPTLEQGSLWPTILKTKLPLELCFSPDDTVTSPTNFPAKLFENPNVRAFEPPVPQLASSGDHLQAQVLCSNSALFAFLSQPLPIEPLDWEQEKVCLKKDNVDDKGDNDDDKGVTGEEYFLPAVIGGVVAVAVAVAVVMYCCCCRSHK